MNNKDLAKQLLKIAEELTAEESPDKLADAVFAQLYGVLQSVFKGPPPKEIVDLLEQIEDRLIETL